MRILHTSDWHLGHVLYDYERLDEHRHILERIKDIVAEKKPDLFLLCGDVFHVSQPSAAAQKLLAESMMAIHDARPGMVIVMTAGNHDSASRHESLRVVWERTGVHTVGTLNRREPESHLIDIPGKGVVAALPYAYERSLTPEFIQELLDSAGKMAPGLPVILTAHTTVAGCSFHGHLNATDKIVGGIDAMPIENLGTGYDYLALGHIHYPHTFRNGPAAIHYSGSPLPVSFDEDYPHGVTLVEIGRHGEKPVIEQIEIEGLRSLVSIPPKKWAPWSEVMDLLAKFPDDRDDYIRLNVEIEGTIHAGAKEEIRKIIENKKCRFCLINSKRKTVEKSGSPALGFHEFLNMEPRDILTRYFKDTGSDTDGKLTELFDETLHLMKADTSSDTL